MRSQLTAIARSIDVGARRYVDVGGAGMNCGPCSTSVPQIQGVLATQNPTACATSCEVAVPVTTASIADAGSEVVSPDVFSWIQPTAFFVDIATAGVTFTLATRGKNQLGAEGGIPIAVYNANNPRVPVNWDAFGPDSPAVFTFTNNSGGAVTVRAVLFGIQNK